jgi:phosphatidylglycerol:prolipoprotein diacylglycerol transferase
MITAIAVGATLSRRTQRGLQLAPYEKIGIALGAYCGAMIGAKLPFVFSDWQGLLSGAAWFSDGKTILCGLVGGYFGVEVAKWSLQIQTKTGDSFAVPVAVAVSIGRLGCFSAGCCYGTPTTVPWAVVFSQVDQLPRHPTQLYESAFHFGFAMVLAWCYRRGFFPGQLIKLYIIGYALYRFASEFIRPEARQWYGLTGYQLASALLVVLFGWLWWRDVRQSQQAGPACREVQSGAPASH